jgi:hypothetical protein
MRKALGIREPQDIPGALRPDPLTSQPFAPELQRRDRPHPPRHQPDHPITSPPRAGTRILEERQVHPRAALVVPVEQVVDGRVVLVDGLLDEPQSQDANVEADVLRRVAGDRGDVVDAFELHGRPRIGADGVGWSG